jgi:FtsH-binding integral membrane protein
MNLEKTVATDHDVGLRSYLTSIYNWMTLGLLATAGVSFFSVASGLTTYLAQHTALFWIAALAPFGVIFYMARGMSGRSSVSSMALSFIFLAACQGLTLSLFFAQYTAVSVVTAFMVTAAGFAGLSLYAYTTKRDLTGMGSFFLVALIGLIVALIVGIFLASPVFNILVSMVAVVIFAGLVAYDTQTMRANYIPGDEDSNARHAIWHALDLYLDFINLLIHMLRLIGVNTGSSND